MVPTVQTSKTFKDGARGEWRQSTKKDMLLGFSVCKNYG